MREVGPEALEFGIDHRIGAVSGDYPAIPAALPDRRVMFQPVERAFGRGDHLDTEPLEQRARTEGIGREHFGDVVEVEDGRLGIEPHLQPEDFGKDPVEPHPRRRAAEQVVALGQEPPRLARVGVGIADPQRLQRHALRIEHAEYVVVGHEQQIGRVAESRVAAKPRGIGVAVRADDRQLGHRRVEFARDTPCPGVGRQEPVGVKCQRTHRRLTQPPAKRSRVCLEIYGERR